MKVRVSNVAFSKNAFLVTELRKHFPDAIINTESIRFQGDELSNFFSDSEGVIVGLERIDEELLNQLPSLKVIAKYGVGLDNIDLEACKRRNIKIGWTGGVNKRSVAEMALGFMLALCRNLYNTSNQLKHGVWKKDGGYQLSGQTVGIIGFGNIGIELVKLLKPFGCNILVNDIIDISVIANDIGAKNVSKEHLFKESDLISIHTPLTNLTLNLINKESLLLMKPNAFIINTARGGIINEVDLKWALKNNIIGGAALDVYEKEPPTDIDFLNLKNLICTPHTGGNSSEAVIAMGMSAIQHLLEFITNKES